MDAFVFPGQGSQFVGMGADLLDHPQARVVFEEADDALGFSITRLCLEGPEKELKLTENTQPAILTVSTALLRLLEARDCHPEFVAGHSLGEYSALVASGALTFGDAVRIVRQRGRFMQEAVPVGVGAMAAIIGLDIETVSSVCRQVSSEKIVSPANINSPDQIVIAGHTEALEQASRLADQAGARMVIRLPVSAPFHCALMEPAQRRLSQVLNATDFHSPKVPLVNNVEAQVITDPDSARDGLVRQVSSAVKWSECVEVLLGLGIGRFVEVGPGRVLSGLIRRVSRKTKTVAAGTIEQVTQVASA